MIDLTQVAIGLTILGIVVAIGAVVLDKIAVSRVGDLPTFETGNESVTLVSGTANLANPWATSISSVINATDESAIAAANYTLTVDPNTGLSTITNASVDGNYPWLVTYNSRNVSDVRYDLPSKALTGIGEYGNWFKILVIVGIAGVILYLVMKAFGTGSLGGSKTMGTNY